jgi:hypothetical protein
LNEQQEKLKAFLIQMTNPLDEQFEDNQSFSPMWIVDNGQLIVIATPWADNHEKVASVNYVKNKMRELKAHRYVQIAEVWTVHAKEMPESIKQGASLASHPDRREAVIAVAEDKHGNHFMMRRFILRPEHGKATLAPAEIEDMSAHHSEGLMTHLLSDHNG